MATATKRLKRARKIRHVQASELAALSSGALHIADVIGDPTDALGRVSIHQLLIRTPHIGERGSEKICRSAKVWPTHRLGNLSKKERANLVDALPPRAKLQNPTNERQG